jgi:hypothetical protein
VGHKVSAYFVANIAIHDEAEYQNILRFRLAGARCDSLLVRGKDETRRSTQAVSGSAVEPPGGDTSIAGGSRAIVERHQGFQQQVIDGKSGARRPVCPSCSHPPFVLEQFDPYRGISCTARTFIAADGATPSPSQRAKGPIGLFPTPSARSGRGLGL